MSLRVFAPRPAPGEPAVLDADESHYLRRVRRAPDGAPLELIDDHGALWRAQVRGGDARRSDVDLLGRRHGPPPSPEPGLLPVRPLTLRLQKATVRNDMLFVIGGQRQLVRRDIRNVRIKRWLRHQ